MLLGQCSFLCSITKLSLLELSLEESFAQQNMQTEPRRILAQPPFGPVCAVPAYKGLVTIV